MTWKPEEPSTAHWGMLRRFCHLWLKSELPTITVTVKPEPTLDGKPIKGLTRKDIRATKPRKP